MIRNIIFDFGRVLVDHDLTPLLEGCFKGDSERIEAFRAILSGKEFVDRCDRGLMKFRELIDEAVGKYPEYASAFIYYRDHYLDEITGETAGMREVLAKLRAEGYGLYGLTNWSDTVYSVREKYNILQMLDGTVISSEEHMVKPEPAIYIRLCERFGLRPDECLFTDDRQANVDGALAAGMKAVLFTDAASFVRDLERLLGR